MTPTSLLGNASRPAVIIRTLERPFVISSGRNMASKPTLTKKRSRYIPVDQRNGKGHKGTSQASPYARNINHFMPKNNPRIQGFPHYLRPGLLTTADGEFKGKLLDQIKGMFPDDWKSVPFTRYLTDQIEPTADLQVIDWKSTVLINNHHDLSRLTTIYQLLDSQESELMETVKAQASSHAFKSNKLNKRTISQKRFFSTDAKAPLNKTPYEMKTIDYSTINQEVDGMFQKAPKNLLKVVPDIDQSHYDSEALDAFTTSRLNDVHAYLSNLYKYKNYHPKLQNEDTFRQLERDLLVVNNFRNSLLSIDLETYERDNKLATEIGITIFDPLKEAGAIMPNLIKIHIIIEENKHLRNGIFVADNQQSFIGGHSMILAHKEALSFVQSLINHYLISRKSLNMNTAVVGHCVGGDIRWLKEMGVVFPENLLIVDSQKLYSAINGSRHSSLGAILRRFNIPHSYLHNAGNDSYFTLLALMKLTDVSFRDRFKLDDFNNDIKHQANFAKLKDKRSLKERERNSSGSAESSPKIGRNKKIHETFEFAYNETHRGFATALKSTFDKE